MSREARTRYKSENVRTTSGDESRDLQYQYDVEISNLNVSTFPSKEEEVMVQFSLIPPL